jgi:hypothetical protein
MRRCILIAVLVSRPECTRTGSSFECVHTELSNLLRLPMLSNGETTGHIEKAIFRIGEAKIVLSEKKANREFRNCISTER